MIKIDYRFEEIPYGLEVDDAEYYYSAATIGLDYDLDFSNQMKEFDKKIKSFLKKKMYFHKNVIRNTNKGKKIINKLFLSIKKNPKRYLNVSKYNNSNIERSISDFIAGMTDRYAINLYNKIK